MSDGAVLTATGLRRRFGRAPRVVEALRDASLTLRDGELVLLLGGTGAGKTTLPGRCGGLAYPASSRVIARSIVTTPRGPTPARTAANPASVPSAWISPIVRASPTASDSPSHRARPRRQR